MDTLQLTKILTNCQSKDKCVQKKLLPDKKPLDEKAYIINTDNSTDPGEQ